MADKQYHLEMSEREAVTLTLLLTMAVTFNNHMKMVGEQSDALVYMMPKEVAGILAQSTNALAQAVDVDVDELSDGMSTVAMSIHEKLLVQLEQVTSAAVADSPPSADGTTSHDGVVQ